MNHISTKVNLVDLQDNRNYERYEKVEIRVLQRLENIDKQNTFCFSMRDERRN